MGAPVSGHDRQDEVGVKGLGEPHPNPEIAIE